MSWKYPNNAVSLLLTKFSFKILNNCQCSGEKKERKRPERKWFRMQRTKLFHTERGMNCPIVVADSSYRAQICFCKTKSQCASTHHSHTASSWWGRQTRQKTTLTTHRRLHLRANQPQKCAIRGVIHEHASRTTHWKTHPWNGWMWLGEKHLYLNTPVWGFNNVLNFLLNCCGSSPDNLYSEGEVGMELTHNYKLCHNW